MNDRHEAGAAPGSTRRSARRRSSRRRSQALLIAAALCVVSSVFFLLASLDGAGNPSLRRKMALVFFAAALLLLLWRTVSAALSGGGRRRAAAGRGARSGLALPVALVLGAALSALALHALAAERARTRLAESAARSRRLGAAAGAEALRRLRELAADADRLVDHPGEDWAKDAAYALPGGIRVSSRVEDENRRFNLNNLALSAADSVTRPVAAALAELLALAGAGDPRRRVESLRAALRNPDDAAEPRFRPLCDWGQLTDIEGFDRDFLERDADGVRRRLRPADALTVAPSDVLRPMPLNLNTAPAEVLAGLFGRERPDIVRSVEALREGAPLRSLVPLARRMDPVAFTRLAPWISVHSTFFRVTARAADPRGERVVMALASRELDGRVRILEWAEN